MNLDEVDGATPCEAAQTHGLANGRKTLRRSASMLLPGQPMPRILLAEDFREIRNLIVQILGRDGYEIDAVTNGNEAIEKLSAEDYDVILLDYMMPVASGRDVLDWIAANRPGLGTACVIVITAAMRELGKLDLSTIYAAIAKPFEVEHLRDTVRNCISDRSTIPAVS